MDSNSLTQILHYFFQCLFGLDTETTDKEFSDTRPTNISIMSYFNRFNSKSVSNLDKSVGMYTRVMSFCS